MAKKIAGKKPVKKSKTATDSKAKKKPAKKVRSLSAGGVKKPAKKSAAKKVKKVLTEKEIQNRQANLIVNSEKKGKGKRPKKITDSKQTNSLLDCIVEGMQEKKAKNITVLNLAEIENRICDYFVICDADSTTHVDAIANSVEDMVIKKCGEKPYHSEGYQNSEWILIDYINIVVHVFLRETREYYNIEGLWGDAEVTTID